MEAVLAAIGTILGTAALLIVRDIRDGKHPFKKNGSYEAQQTLKKIETSQSQLQHHYNDETTAELKKLNLGIEELSKTVYRHLISEESFQDAMKDFMRDMRTK